LPWNSREKTVKMWNGIVILHYNSVAINFEHHKDFQNIVAGGRHIFSAKKEEATNVPHLRPQNTSFGLVFSTNSYPDGVSTNLT
jgi:hypothetical protein